MPSISYYELRVMFLFVEFYTEIYILIISFVLGFVIFVSKLLILQIENKHILMMK